MITRADLPDELNLATWFVDRNVEEGRGERTALIGPRGKTTYAELAGLVNRCGNLLLELGVRAGERVLLVLGDSVEFVALWYGAQKIGAVTAEAYTFLQPKDYAYYLDYTDAAVVVADETTKDVIREVAGERQVLVVDDELRARLEQLPDELEPAPTTKDDICLWKFTTGSTGRPKGAVHPVHSPVLSHEWYARGVLGIREDDVVLPVPKLFFGYARDLTALYPFGVGGAGIVFPERTTAERIFGLIAEHRPTILVNVPTMMAQMIDHPDAAAPGSLVPAPLHVGRRGIAARPARPLARDVRGRGARRDRVVRAVPHLHLEPARARAAGLDRRARPRLRGGSRRQRRAARHRRHGRAPLLGGRGEDAAHVRRRHRAHGRPLRPRRRRLLLVPRPRRRPDQGRRHLGRSGRDRALPRRPPGRRRVRGRRRGAERADDSARVRGRAPAGRGTGPPVVRPRAVVAAQVPARGRLPGRAAEDAVRKARPEGTLA